MHVYIFYVIRMFKESSTHFFFDYLDVVGVAELCNKVGGKFKLSALRYKQCQHL